MSPKEKANELFDMFHKIGYVSFKEYETILVPVGIAKVCALIAVEEMIEAFWYTHKNESEYRYWIEVKKEIEAL